MSKLNEFTKGIIKENPVLVTMLGMCPTLAVTTMAENSIGMGLATTFVLLGSNLIISLLKNFIPKQVRLPSYIVIIAGLVTLIGFIMQALVPDLYDALGLFLSLITVNCIILGRAEAFASKNTLGSSILDALGMGTGFTLALLTIGSIREILGAGTWFGINLIGNLEPMLIFIMPAGGFFVFGMVIAILNKIAHRKPPEKIGCASCPARVSCTSFTEKGECAE